MSFASPIYPEIPRQSVVGEEGIWVKMFDPPTASPPTPELVAPTNPVPEVMQAAGLQGPPIATHTVHRHMMSGHRINAWDGKELEFFVVSDDDNPTAASGTWPGPTIRIPRGVVFHTVMKGAGPPPHTIHWHGIEPTAINDGVGHCSMEVGDYIYQFQPNFIGSYFYHCHRNTVQHFEFGLYGFIVIDPPDAFFASCATDPRPGGAVTLNTTPIGNGRPEAGFPQGRRRTAANLAKFTQFPGWNSNAIDAPDPEASNPALPAWLKFQTDPHAMTIPYDVEVLWVPDDRDSVWSDLASNARQAFPAHGTIPGVNDTFDTDRASFAAFNQFNADYWFVTGVNFPGPKGGTGTIDSNIVVPAALMSGVSGVQVPINAQVNQTILLRCLNAAYNDMTVTLPVDAVIIAWDGRGLGVGPFGQYNHAYLLPANTPVHVSVARRFDALIRSSSPINSFATVQFVSTTAEEVAGVRPVLFTGRIPFNIGTAAGALAISGSVVNSLNGQPIANAQMNLTGATSQMVFTDAAGNYSFSGLADGRYTVTPSHPSLRFFPRERKVTVSGANQLGQFFRGRGL
jgi:hypothetical protein